MLYARNQWSDLPTVPYIVGLVFEIGPDRLRARYAHHVVNIILTIEAIENEQRT